MFNIKLINFFRNYRLTIAILLSVILGVITGNIMGEKAHMLLPFGTIFLNLTFMIVTPLIFFSVSSSIANIIMLDTAKKTILASIGVFISMSFVATIFALIVVKIFPFFVDLNIPLSFYNHSGDLREFGNFATIFTSSDFGRMLTKEAILPLIIFSLLFGAAVKLSGERGEGIKTMLSNCSFVMYKMVDFLMIYAPVGLFAYFAAFTGNSSADVVESIGKVATNFYITIILFGVLFYALYAYIAAGSDGVKAFRYAIIPSVIAFATRSSLATLPIALEAGKKMNLPKSIANIGMPLGSIMHLDGTSVVTVIKIALLFSLFGMDMSGASFYINTILISVFACLFSSGIPGGGMILETFIVTSFGFPAEGLPILVVLNVLTDPIITLINVNGNIAGTMLVSRIIRGRGWIFRKEIEKDPILNIYK